MAAEQAMMEGHSRARFLPTGLLGAPYAVYGVLLALCSRRGFPESMQPGGFWPYLADQPISEDTFLMLTAAWHLGAGDGLAYNHGAPVTGVQPLVTLLYAALAAVAQGFGADRWDFVRLVLLLSVPLHLWFAHLVGTIAARCSDAPRAHETAFALALYAFFAFQLFASGMETGLYLALLALVLRKSLDSRFESRGDFVVLGVLCGVAGLCRIDAGVLFAAFGLWLWRGRGLAFGSLVLAAGIAALIVSPWFLWVHAVSGHWLPSSGYVQQTLVHADAGLRAWAMAFALFQAALPWVDWSARFAPSAHFALLIAAGAMALAGAAHGLRRRRVPGSAGARQLATLRAFGLAALVLAAVYGLLFHAVHFYARYVAPLMVGTLPLVGIFAAERFQRGLDRAGVRAAAFALLAAACFAQAYQWNHRGRLRMDFAVTAGYVARHFPDVRVGAFQSGVVGYFNPNVVNLDGKVNLELIRGSAASLLPGYLDRKGIEVIVDWRWVIAFGNSGIPDDYLEARWQPCPVPMTAWAICLRRKAAR